jgi:hypothetical protein
MEVHNSFANCTALPKAVGRYWLIGEPQKMPLVRFDAVEGRSEQKIKNLLDAVHRAMLSALILSKPWGIIPRARERALGYGRCRLKLALLHVSG